MHATITQTIDTVWANSLTVEVSGELDNPHLLTTRELATLMVRTMRTYVEEIRAENEREILRDTTGPGEAKERLDRYHDEIKGENQ